MGDAVARRVHAIVLAAGANTRLKGIVPPFLKPLILVNGRPLVQHATRFALEVGVGNITVVVSPDNARGVTSVLSTNFQFVVQPEADGVVDAIKRALEPVPLSEWTLILCADNTFEPTIRSLPEQQWFGSREMNDANAARRFTRWDKRPQANGVYLYDAHHTTDMSTKCWIGPLMLSTSRLHKALEHKITNDDTIVDLIKEVTNDGCDIEPMLMMCNDMGIPEELAE